MMKLTKYLSICSDHGHGVTLRSHFTCTGWMVGRVRLGPDKLVQGGVGHNIAARCKLGTTQIIEGGLGEDLPERCSQKFTIIMMY